MKKLFAILYLVGVAVSTLTATEKVVWTGNEPISWNTEVYPGTQFETPAGIFSGLQKDYIIRVSVVPGIDEPQYVMTYKAGEGWIWTDLTTAVEDSIMSYTVETNSIATEIADRGLIFRGQGYNITSITVDDLLPDSVPPVDPQPGDTTIAPAVPGEYEQILWQGDSAISWNTEVYAGGEFETAADLFAGLLINDTIRVYTAEAIQDAQYNLTYKAGESWSWTELPTTVENGVIRYVVESATIAQEVAERGIIVRGQGYHMTYITVTAHSTDTITPIDPQPNDSIDLTGLVETILWTGDAAISWNSEEYAGDKLDTRSISETMFAGLQENDIICITYAEAAEDAQFGLQYKAGDDWSWTDLNYQLSTINNQILYRVASDEMAMLIADRGLVITGIKYHATKISLFTPHTEGIKDIQEDNAPATKFIKNGRLYILRDGKTFNALGQMIESY
ncbi:MAG: hypothetical protein IJU36_05325 [Paludibacteraceae bacterium]|nr:hypothetical protein [Paludibacteraceae bacterium]